jgi:hypothetical protein
MSTQATATSTHHLVAVWDMGIGATARTVACLNARTSETVGLQLAEALTIASVWIGKPSSDSASTARSASA